MKTAALILARAGSKSIPDKNIKLFNGKPLIIHCLSVVTSCKFFDEIWVSTDSEKLSTLVRNYSPAINVHSRDPRQATDRSSSLESVKEFLQNHANSFDTIALIQCTSPCLRIEYLEEAFRKMLNPNLDSVFSAYHCDKLRWRLEPETGQLKATNFDPRARPRRQDICQRDLVESGHFYWFRTKLVVEEGLLQSMDGRGSTVIVRSEDCIELDYPDQWEVAELMARSIGVETA